MHIKEILKKKKTITMRKYLYSLFIWNTEKYLFAHALFYLYLNTKILTFHQRGGDSGGGNGVVAILEKCRKN